MALFLLEDRDFKGFWMKIWNAGVSVITRSTFSSFTLSALLLFFIYAFSIFIYNLCMCVKKENFNSRGGGKLYTSFENEQYEYIHEAYGSVELYAIYKVLICFVYTLPLLDTWIVYMRFYIFKIVFLS